MIINSEIPTIAIEYDGKWPSLCMGQLIVILNGERLIFPGCCIRPDDDAPVGQRWEITKWPTGFPPIYQLYVTQALNEFLPPERCGGCL